MPHAAYCLRCRKQHGASHTPCWQCLHDAHPLDCACRAAEFKSTTLKVTSTALTVDASSSLKLDGSKLSLDTKTGAFTATSLNVSGSTNLGTASAREGGRAGGVDGWLAGWFV